MTVGGRLWGPRGAILGIAAMPLLHYPILAWSVRRHGAWTPGLDLVALGAGGLLILVATVY